MDPFPMVLYFAGVFFLGIITGRVLEKANNPPPSLTTTAKAAMVAPPELATRVEYFGYQLVVVDTYRSNGYDGGEEGARCQYKRDDGKVRELWFTSEQFWAIFGRQLAARGEA